MAHKVRETMLTCSQCLDIAHKIRPLQDVSLDPQDRFVLEVWAQKRIRTATPLRCWWQTMSLFLCTIKIDCETGTVAYLWTIIGAKNNPALID